MKTTRSFILPLILIAAMGFYFSSCSKEKKQNGSSDSESMQQLTKDEINVENASDEALNDVNTVLSGGGMKSTMLWPCNATIDSATIQNDTITYHITYDGKNCSGTLDRHGKVTVKRKVGEKWWMPGATVTVTMIDLQITKVASGKSVTFNGTKLFQNVTGGKMWQLWSGEISSIIHKVSGAISATFDDNSTRIWNVARQRAFTIEDQKLIMTIDGFGNADGYSNLVLWGTNRHGEAFYTQITQSIVHKQRCDMDPCSGIKIHQIPSMEKSATITFGYNDNNEPIQGNECPTRFRVDWVKGSHSGTLYLPLH